MERLNEKLIGLRDRIQAGRKVKIAILGLGSVGNYLLDYLNAWSSGNVEIVVGTRSVEKAASDVNIVRVASLIRSGRAKEIALRRVDLDDVDAIADFIADMSPDFIVNASRVYSGLKYGSISWANIRAYGLWAPLAVRYIQNVMEAHARARSRAIVINTSYSDAVIPWLKTAGRNYPDFGSGNLNHLVPRIKMAVAAECRLADIENIDVTLCTSHFHDVVISKEGQTEGVEPLLHVAYRGAPLAVDSARIWPRCALAMPVDAKRNMMNASSNFEIIRKIVEASSSSSQTFFHSPGVGGQIGGYPVSVDFSRRPIAQFDERHFSLAAMQDVNRRSIYLDGIENVADGVLTYTDELRAKVARAFGCEIPKRVALDECPAVADFIIENIIRKSLKGS